MINYIYYSMVHGNTISTVNPFKPVSKFTVASYKKVRDGGEKDGERYMYIGRERSREGGLLRCRSTMFSG